MKTILIGSVLGVALLGLIFACQQSGPTTQPSAGADNQRISGPYSHKNLTIFLIHGPDTIKGDSYLTIQEALEHKKLVIYETQNVNELAIENVSDEPVFIQSGDIVKGGQQDRTMGTDLIASAHSGKIPIAAFCVEHGRWSQRGSESVAQFKSSDAMVVGGAMKLAGNVNSGKADQSQVWASVTTQTASLSRAYVSDLTDIVSPSSFQLTLENEKLQRSTDEFVKALGPSIEGKPDVIGYAVAINGKINSADVYGSNALFKKLWNKLLKSSAVEALAEPDPSVKPPTVSADDVRKFLSTAENANAQRKTVNNRTEAVTHDAKDSILLQTDDTEAGITSVRRSYLTKPEK